MSDHAEKVRRYIQFAPEKGTIVGKTTQTDAQRHLDALVAERDGLRARVEQLEAERDAANGERVAYKADNNRLLSLVRECSRQKEDALTRVEQLEAALRDFADEIEVPHPEDGKIPWFDGRWIAQRLRALSGLGHAG